jgi:hypothetical protein
MSLSQQGGVVIAITNCNLIVPPNYFAIGVAPYNNPTAVMSAISQSNSKAKLRNSLTGQEIPKNTTFANQIMYQVVGSQT